MSANGTAATERQRSGHRTNAPLSRISANLTARSARALEEVIDMTGDSQTDAINRALQVYAYLERVQTEGGEVLTRQAGQDPVVLRFF